MEKLRVFKAIYPEFGAGEYQRHNGRIQFFTRIRTLLPENAAVLDFGAGRGKFAETEPGPMRNITFLKPQVERLAAFDVDDAVLENLETSDTAYAPIGEPLPYPDNSFDLIYSWMVFEHIADPAFYASEIQRILKPGGWLCASTPNKWGVVGCGARLIPNGLHVKLLRFFSPSRKSVDTFPTTYLLNRKTDVRKHFPASRFDDHSFYTFTGPAYHANKIWLAYIWIAINWITPPSFKQNFQIFLQKKSP